MQSSPTTSKETRVHITVSGVVQGVGFRPFIFNLATRHALQGYVRNRDGLVEIEAQGPPESIRLFVDQIHAQSPPLSLIEQVVVRDAQCVEGAGARFEIRASEASDTRLEKFVPPDTATCSECTSELFDPANRRYRYPFINCTNCGPRFTIISTLPYDRPSTTMASFKMCAQCQDEYEDPSNRRFHAQPNACSVCGPSIQFKTGPDDRCERSGENALSFALDRLREGQIIAVKGLGGFHLVCDAADSRAIERLRGRKHRSRKPFAVMMPADMVHDHCYVTGVEERELTSIRRPVVLLRKLPASTLSEAVAPGIDRLGVMLPYTPLHHLLMADYGRPLIATSGNLSEEPIAIDNAEAMLRLAQIADGFLIHDRQIYSRYDDSVVQFVATDKTYLRRSRGVAPLPVKLPFMAEADVLACGGHLKNTFCLVHRDQAFVSQHIGDLENIETHEHFEHALDTFIKLFDIKPEMVAHDCHPDYLSSEIASKFAGERSLPLFGVQHHHAHIVSCMVENGICEPVIGVAFDGLGYGADGTLWGGEFLLASLAEYKRMAHFAPVPLPGGVQGIKQPWRMAMSYLVESQNTDAGCLNTFLETLAGRYGRSTVGVVRKQIERRINSPLTSSCGRLFDAMSALVNVCHQAEYEGQAAMELEAIASRHVMAQSSHEPYPYSLNGTETPFVIEPAEILQAAYSDYLSGEPAEAIAYRFHYTVAHVVQSVCLALRDILKIEKVCLSGGVFQNALLVAMTKELLASSGFSVFIPRQLPANDGGLSLGQAVVALARAQAIAGSGK